MQWDSLSLSLSLAFSWVRLLVTYRANHRERIGLAKGRMAMVFYDGSCRIVKNRIGLSLKGQETKNFKFRSGFYSCIACLSRVRTYIYRYFTLFQRVFPPILDDLTGDWSRVCSVSLGNM